MVELTSIGPPEVFHYFPRLPPEVRFMIWEWAARSLRTKRGAYFFAFQSLSFIELEKATKVDWQMSCQANKGDNWHRRSRSLPKIPDTRYPFLKPEEKSWHLMAPHWDHTEVSSNNPTRNPSTYMIHGGLWAACWDSHQALRRRMQKVRRSVRRQLETAWVDVQWKYGHQLEVSGTFLQKDREQMSFTLYPERDLICLQLPFAQAHHCRIPMKDGDWPNFQVPFDKPKHIALEFDPSWKVDPKSEWNNTSQTKGLPALVADLLEVDDDDSRLWFIDYRLRRNGWKPEVERPWNLEPGRHVFRGNGCKFVEVSSSSEYWDTRSRHYPQAAGTYHHVHALVHDLKRWRKKLMRYESDWRIWRIDNSSDDGWWDDPYFLRKVGVLACVWDE
ncbi:hypothetical protein PG984_003887 [Apiospora sp. TS-2023a]